MDRGVDAERREVRVDRLVVGGDADPTRLVAEVVDGVAELRLEVTDAPAGLRTAAVVFASAGSSDLGIRLGLQLWVDGNLVRAFDLFADELS